MMSTTGIYCRRLAFREKSNDTTLCNSQSCTGQTLTPKLRMLFFEKLTPKNNHKFLFINKSI